MLLITGKIDSLISSGSQIWTDKQGYDEDKCQVLNEEKDIDRDTCKQNCENLEADFPESYPDTYRFKCNAYQFEVGSTETTCTHLMCSSTEPKFKVGSIIGSFLAEG